MSVERLQRALDSHENMDAVSNVAAAANNNNVNANANVIQKVAPEQPSVNIQNVHESEEGPGG
jgi:hypothetical protein